MAQDVGSGRHQEPNQSRYRVHVGSDGLWVRPTIIAVGVVLGVIAAVWRWSVTTPLLGVNLPPAAHVTLVATFLVVVVLVIVLSTRWAYRRLARWSQARRARELARTNAG